MTIDMTQFLQAFFEESFEGLELMETELLNIDKNNYDAETINSIFRAAHSIKGGAGTFGLPEVSDYTHVMETLLDEMRDGRRDITPEGIEILLKSTDTLREMLTAIQNESDIDQEKIDATQAELKQLLGSGNTTPSSASATSDESTTKNTNGTGWHISFRPHPHMLKTGNEPARIIRELNLLGETETTPVLDKVPAIEELDPEDIFIGWEIDLSGDIPRQQIEELFEWVEDDCDLSIQALETESVDETDTTTTENTGNSNNISLVPAGPRERRHQGDRRAAGGDRRIGGSESSASIRVGTDKIDALINMVGELVITQSMLSQLGSEFELSKLEKLLDGLSQLERNTRELQENVMRIRMLPISFAFNRIPRMVHDLTNKLGKQVELTLSGEQTELDKTVLEKIGDPLVHLVRNAIDHGIEKPDDRTANGKHPVGSLHLDAYHQGGNIIIEIRDDGAGINEERVLQKARDLGLVAEHENPAPEEIHDLIFHPGFSTAQEISDVSGRGVGMDVVRKNIRSLGGSVEVRSERNSGTTFIIRLPLTLAILDGQLLQVGNQTFIIQLTSIVESLQVYMKKTSDIAGSKEMYRLRDEYIPVIRLHEIFNVETEITSLDEGLLIVVEGEGGKVGLFVDDLLGQQQVVIKSLESNFQKIEGISGATILGDGRVALILDVSELIHISNTPKGNRKARTTKKGTEAA